MTRVARRRARCSTLGQDEANSTCYHLLEYVTLDVLLLINGALLEVHCMKMKRVMIQLPAPLKTKLDALRGRGTSAAGLIRHLLEQHFKGKKAA